MPDDRQLAKRLARDAKAAAKQQARLQEAHAHAVRRREAARAAARRALPVRLVVSVATGLAAFPLDYGAGFLAAVTSAGYGLAAYRSWRVLNQPPVPALSGLLAATAVPPAPSPGSAAWPAVRRLEGVRAELQRLLPLVSPAGRAAAEEAWQAAGEADNALRWQAARLAAVEPHRGADPELLEPLLAGVECQEKLVVAVADLVAASADSSTGERLQAATDRLHGLAQGLREVR